MPNIRRLHIDVQWKYLDGWCNENMEYALVEIKIAHLEPELSLFMVDHNENP